MRKVNILQNYCIFTEVCLHLVFQVHIMDYLQKDSLITGFSNGATVFHC